MIKIKILRVMKSQILLVDKPVFLGPVTYILYRYFVTVQLLYVCIDYSLWFCLLDTSIIDFGSVTSVTIVIQSTPSQSVNITANEGTGDNNSATVAIVASVAGSLLVLCIIGICIIAIMVKKRRNRSHQKMKHLEFSAVSL